MCIDTEIHEIYVKLNVCEGFRFHRRCFYIIRWLNDIIFYKKKKYRVYLSCILLLLFKILPPS